MIRTEINIAPAIRALTAIGRQVDFAAANALNDTAFEFRDTERRGISDRMVIRRNFVLQGIQVPRGKTARRDNLVVEVEVESKRDFLAKFEEGGTKQPREGRHLAVPEAARPTPQSLIPNRLRPIGLQIAEGDTQGVAFRKAGSKSFLKHGPVRLTGARRKNQGLYRTFLIEGVGIFQRVGRGSGSSVRLLWAFTTRAHIDPDLRFLETAQDVVQRSFTQHFNRRFVDALRTARV